MKRLTASMCMAVLFSLFALTESPPSDRPVLDAPYIGQSLPGDEPVLFAPGIVSTALFTRDFAMTPDGRELYFCVSTGGYSYSAIAVTRIVEGRWTVPEVAPFSVNPAYRCGEPFITPDGKYFFFMSARPAAQEPPPGGRLTLDYFRRMAQSPGCGNPAIDWMSASFIERLRPKAE